MNDQEKGLVSLVGSGPGDPELFTQKAIRRLREADVIFHDKLSPNELVTRYGKSGISIVDVGKRKGKIGPSQEEINHKLIRASRDYDRVVRLKGGDPYLFGRGGEEAEYLAEHGIPFEVIPGISSLLAAPNYAGIPATHRNHSSSLTVITGHLDPEGHEHDWEALARMDTLVVMMGITISDDIAQDLLKAGLAKETPCAVIGWGTTPEQNTLETTLSQLANGLDDPKSYLPGLIIIGKVVDYRRQLNWFENRALFGKKILVTRPEKHTREFARKLRERGARPLCYPTIQISKIDAGMRKLRGEMDTLNKYDGLIFTSRNGVRFFFESLEQKNLDTRALGKTSVAAIGPGTGGELERFHCVPDMIPPKNEAEHLAHEIKNHFKEPAQFLLPRAKGARSILPDILESAGHSVTEIHIYEAIPGGKETSEQLQDQLTDQVFDMITFTSASTVDNLFEMIPENEINLTEILSTVDIACIGPITAHQLIERGINVEVTAEEFSIPGLMTEIEEFYQGATA